MSAVGNVNNISLLDLFCLHWTHLCPVAFCFAVHSPFRINRRDVYPGRGSEGQGRRPGNDFVVRSPRPLRLSPWQRGKLQVAGETSSSTAQVDTQCAGRRCEGLTEAAIRRLFAVLRRDRTGGEAESIKEHRSDLERQRQWEMENESTPLYSHIYSYNACPLRGATDLFLPTDGALKYLIAFSGDLLQNMYQ